MRALVLPEPCRSDTLPFTPPRAPNFDLEVTMSR